MNKIDEIKLAIYESYEDNKITESEKDNLLSLLEAEEYQSEIYKPEIYKPDVYKTKEYESEEYGVYKYGNERFHYNTSNPDDLKKLKKLLKERDNIVRRQLMLYAIKNRMKDEKYKKKIEELQQKNDEIRSKLNKYSA